MNGRSQERREPGQAGDDFSIYSRETENDRQSVSWAFIPCFRFSILHVAHPLVRISVVLWFFFLIATECLCLFLSIATP